MILLIDNYDSFSYNLYQYIGSLNKKVKVIRSDEYSCEDIKAINPSRIIISSGPGKPSDAGICKDLIEYMKGQVPVLGIGLGHLVICEVFGGEIVYANELIHGKASLINIDTDNILFDGLNKQIQVARYHSLTVKKATFPNCLEIIGTTIDGEVMAVKHKDYEIFGVQFNPKSILTENGLRIIENFIC